jgi:LmeA-like phospholipid-binding
MDYWFLLSAKLSPKTRGIISSVLSSACAAWLRTQVSEVAELKVEIVAGDRQMMAGTIPAVKVAAQSVVYRGIAVQQIELLAEEIAINLKQVVRGKPLQLLQPIVVTVNGVMTNANLCSSLTVPILANALTDLVKQILASPDQNWSIQWQSALIQTSNIALTGQLQQNQQLSSISIQSGIELTAGRFLRLAPLVVEGLLALPASHLHSYEIDLGDQFNLQELTLTDGQLLCQGEIQVNP